jgi:hypothetical protein
MSERDATVVMHGGDVMETSFNNRVPTPQSASPAEASNPYAAAHAASAQPRHESVRIAIADPQPPKKHEADPRVLPLPSFLSEPKQEQTQKTPQKEEQHKQQPPPTRDFAWGNTEPAPSSKPRKTEWEAVGDGEVELFSADEQASAFCACLLSCVALKL